MNPKPSISTGPRANDASRAKSGEDRLSATQANIAPTGNPGSALNRFAILYARLALGAAFLSAVASRFGLWQGEPGMAHFPNFIHRTAELNFFMPASTIPFLAWAATILEITLGLALLAGGVLDLISTQRLQWLRPVAAVAAILLAIFGTTMALSAGIKDPLDYSVFSGSACALLLALWPQKDLGHRSSSSRHEED